MKRNQLVIYLLSLVPVAVVAALGGWVTSRGMDAYALLEKPMLTPPAIVFPLVWSVLYLLMAVGAARVFLTGKPGRWRALAVYGAQLFVNLMWSFLFFGLGLYLISFFWILLLLVLVVTMIMRFYPLDKTAALLQLPYILWLLLAAYLNLSVFLLNR